jgi:Ribbon-helix-helix protein, copG family
MPSACDGVATAGTICGMSVKTTLYLPDDMKAEIEREARRRGIAEAEVIRRALAAGLSRPRPRAGLITGPAMADHVDELLEGFGSG